MQLILLANCAVIERKWSRPTALTSFIVTRYVPGHHFVCVCVCVCIWPVNWIKPQEGLSFPVPLRPVYGCCNLDGFSSLREQEMWSLKLRL